MKKEILFAAAALLISAGVTAQVNTKTQNQTQTQTQTQVKTQVQDQTKAQTQTQTQVKDQSGDPIMNQTQTRTQNHHGETVSGVAQQTQSGTGKGEIVREQAKMKGDAQKAMKQSKTAKKNKGAAKNVRNMRPATVKGTGAGRK